MSASYRKIDYRLRIAKSVERRMMCYLFQQLAIFHSLKEYNYVGFGSVSFGDFALFHRVLGIDKMVSIERENSDVLRFQFNKPYECIRLEFGESKDILPNLAEIEEKCIVWLDYDGKLETLMLDDIDHLFGKLPSGSMFCISFNSHQDDDRIENRYDQLAKRIDHRYFPLHLNRESNLNKKELKQTYYDIIDNVILQTLEFRRANADLVKYQQLLHIDYSDGVDMTTLGWLIYNEEDQQKVDLLTNGHPSFVRTGATPFVITVPILTFKEMKTIETTFPNIDSCLQKFDKNKKGGFLPESDIINFHNIYKYLSLFGEVYI